MRSRMRSPRARLVTSHSGGPGTPPGRHHDRPAGSLLDWDRREPGPRKRGPGLRHPPWADAECRGGAPRGGHPDRKGCAAPRTRGLWLDASRRSAPFASAQGKSVKAQPARQDKRAAERWLLMKQTACNAGGVTLSPLGERVASSEATSRVRRPRQQFPLTRPRSAVASARAPSPPEGRGQASGAVTA